MPDLTDTFAAIDKELAGLLTVEENTASKVDMTFDQFIAYATEQISLAKSDKDPARIDALKQLVSLAKAYTWESNDTFSVPVFGGDLSRQAQSADAERIADHPGKSLPTAPGQQAAPASGAFEAPSGPTGPASNTASPAQRIMPPAFPQSEPASPSKGFMAKAATVLAKADNGEALLAELSAMLEAEAQPGDGQQLQAEVKKVDGWPADLATESFLEDKPAIRDEDNFGTDPGGLGRGKMIRD